MTPQAQQEIQQLLSQKQQWVQRSLQEMQKGNYSKAKEFLNIEGACNESIKQILEQKPESQKTEKVEDETVLTPKD